jgi:hypothetical protein
MSLRKVARIVLTTIFGHDLLSWPYLTIVQRLVFKGSIKQTLGALFGSGSETVTLHLSSGITTAKH